MKYLFFLLLQISLLTNLSAEEKENYKEVSDKFIEYYNSGESDKIYEMFSDNMRNALTPEAFKQTNDAMKLQFGNLNSLEYEYSEGPAAYYKANFEKSTWRYILALNDKNQIDGMLINQYVAPADKKKETKQN